MLQLYIYRIAEALVAVEVDINLSEHYSKLNLL